MRDGSAAASDDGAATFGSLHRVIQQQLMDEDVWPLERFRIEPSRINASCPVRAFRFEGMGCAVNRFWAKRHVYYLVYGTALSVATVNMRHRRVRHFLEWLGGSPVTSLTHDGAIAYRDHLAEGGVTQGRAQELASVRGFLDFVSAHEETFECPLRREDLLHAKTRPPCKISAPPQTVVDQIRVVLPQVENPWRLMFLVIKCTGMRVSETCLLPRNCLEKTAKGCFLSYWQQKMRKDVVNAIPQALFDLMADYAKTSTAPDGYFFGDGQGRLVTTAALSTRLADDFERLGVKNPDGSAYRFRAHDYRHLMAVRMMDEKIPMGFIQEELHHASPDMTSRYIEYGVERKVRQMKSFVDSQGRPAPLGLGEGEIRAEAFRALLAEQVLPNGICSRPVKLGRCKHFNACLSCPDFRTSPCDLPVHLSQLEKTRALAEACEREGLKNQATSARELESTLQTIVAALDGPGKGQPR